MVTQYGYLESMARRFATALIVMGILLGSLATSQSAIHITKAGSPAPDGSLSKPYQVVEAGVLRAVGFPGTSLKIGGGTYYETFTATVPCVMEANGMPVTIGSIDYQAATTLEIITLNTHLAGDELFFPSWKDYERADDIADFFGGVNPRPDVVGFQEIWDEDLFYGGDDANGIRPRSGYPYGEHGDIEGDILNSGCALMSKYPLVDFLQVEWNDCYGPFECNAAKGWVQATIVKDGFSIGLFNLHAQSDYTVSDITARANEMKELRDVVNSYRTAHPDHIVLVLGDFNIYGEANEYNTTLVQYIGLEAGGRDADRNSPGFLFGSSEQWTYCACNPLATYFDSGAVSGRLDYIFYFPSLDGSIEVLPMSVEVLPFIGRTLSEDGLTTNQSSDHWSLHGQFKLIRP